jgi:hypothetical protein
MSWELPLLTSLILSVLGFWWLRSSSNSNLSFQGLLVALVAVLVVVADPRSWLRYLRSPSFETFYALRLDALLATNFRMALTLGAVVW